MYLKYLYKYIRKKKVLFLIDSYPTNKNIYQYGYKREII